MKPFVVACTPIRNRAWIAEKFEPRVDRSGGPEACHPWVGARTPAGYGALRRDGAFLYTHRLAYEFAFGHPGDLHVLHSCDNPPCCNPVHLFLGAQADNVRDMVKKRRNPCGEDNGQAVLTDPEVAEIRRLRGKVPQNELATRFGVTAGHISYLQTGKLRRASPGPIAESGKGVMRHRRGEEAPHAKLTVHDVRAIRAAAGTNKGLASRYGVAQSLIWRIRKGTSWSHVT